jgi:predicted transcriptional regulator
MKTTSFAVRLDDETIDKLKQLAAETDRTMGSVIRVLIRQAEVGCIPDVRLRLMHAGSHSEPNRDRNDG